MAFELGMAEKVTPNHHSQATTPMRWERPEIWMLDTDEILITVTKTKTQNHCIIISIVANYCLIEDAETARKADFFVESCA